MLSIGFDTDEKSTRPTQPTVYIINKKPLTKRGDTQEHIISHLPDVRTIFIVLRSAEIGTVISLVVL